MNKSCGFLFSYPFLESEIPTVLIESGSIFSFYFFVLKNVTIMKMGKVPDSFPADRYMLISYSVVLHKQLWVSMGTNNACMTSS